MRKIYEVGDKVTVTSHREMGLSFTPEGQGTQFKPTETPFPCEIIRAWGDYEIGQRYVGKTAEGEEICFGEFGVTIED